MPESDETLLRTVLERNPRSATIYRQCERYIARHDNDGDWDPEINGEFDFLKKLLPRCHLVFDVGSHIGNWASTALSINPKLDIHCFEASPATHRLLIERVPPLPVTANAFGLGATPETRTLESFGEGNNANSLYRRSGLEARGFPPQQTTESVTLDTADAYCARHNIRHIDFMKIDTEGHDLFVLQGAFGLLRAQAIEVLQFEYGGCNIDSRTFLKDFFELLASVDYLPAKIMVGSISVTEAYDSRLENFRYQNWLALPRKTALSMLGAR